MYEQETKNINVSTRYKRKNKYISKSQKKDKCINNSQKKDKFINKGQQKDKSIKKRQKNKEEISRNIRKEGRKEDINKRNNLKINKDKSQRMK